MPNPSDLARREDKMAINQALLPLGVDGLAAAADLLREAKGLLQLAASLTRRAQSYGGGHPAVRQLGFRAVWFEGVASAMDVNIAELEEEKGLMQD